MTSVIKLFGNSAQTFFVILFLVLFLSSCSSLSSLKFWGNDELDSDEPRPLQEISNIKNIKMDWNLSFAGENFLGNFVPAFSANNIFFADATGQIKSINPSKGKINWEQKINSLSSGIASGFGILVVADIDGNVISLNQTDGSILWSTNVKGEVLAPTAISTKLVIVKTGSGELLALDRDNGSIIWSYRSKLPSLTIRGSSSPVIEDDKVYVSFDNGRLGVFELDSGFPVWDGAISFTEGVSELDNLIDADSSPILEGNRIYTVNFQGNLSVFDAAQRRPVWESKESSFYEPFILRGVLGIISADSKISTYSSRTFEDSWKLEEYALRELSNPETFKGYILVGDLEGYIHAIDPLTGITVARKKISRNKITTLISRSDSFYAIDEKMRLFSLSF